MNCTEKRLQTAVHVASSSAQKILRKLLHDFGSAKQWKFGMGDDGMDGVHPPKSITYLAISSVNLSQLHVG